MYGGMITSLSPSPSTINLIKLFMAQHLSPHVIHVRPSGLGMFAAMLSFNSIFISSSLIEIMCFGWEFLWFTSECDVVLRLSLLCQRQPAASRTINFKEIILTVGLRYDYSLQGPNKVFYIIYVDWTA